MKYITVLFLLAFGASVFASDHQCEGSCTITVCDGTTCVVYRCDTNGCTVVAEYGDEQQRSSAARVSTFDSNSNRLANGSCAGDRCAVKVCDGGVCTVYGFEQGKVIPVATLEDTQSVLDEIISEYISDPMADK